MMDYLQNIILIVLEILCCKIFYETFGVKRYKVCVNLILTVVLSGVILLTVFLLANKFIERQISLIIVISIFMFWSIKISFPKSVILAFLFQSLLLAIDYVIVSMNSKIFSGRDMIEEHYYIQGILVVILGKVILLLCVLLIRKQFGKKSTEMLVDTEWIRFLIFPIFTIAVLSAMATAFNHVETSEQANVLLIIAFGMVGMNIIVFHLINDIIAREIKLHENKAFYLQAKGQIDMYRSISENFDNQKRKTHEYKNQILCIESLLAKKHYEELEGYINGIHGSLNKELDSINTNNVIVNTILNIKYQEAREKGIVFVFRINDLSDIGISDDDIITVLSNLLDNAIEACEGCTDKKVIWMKFVKEHDNVIIAVKNTFNHVIHHENGEIRTTKISQKDEHGVGIKNIIRIIEKYGGEYIIKDKDNLFLFSIMFSVSGGSLSV